mmetsp:Transcript_29961/g.45419  ORF Transcript_29961/g.45419 Transcript_29961/m.45419 type:complete len:572 (+) Transcript_29961:92-1807(+)
MRGYFFTLLFIMQRLFRVTPSQYFSKDVGRTLQRTRTLAAFVCSKHKSPSKTRKAEEFTGYCISLERTKQFSSATPATNDFFAPPDATFESIGIKSKVLMDRIQGLNLERPSAVQAAAYASIVEGGDVTVGAETGSGKTLAYLLPILDNILDAKSKSQTVDYDFARAIILVPNKELVNQFVRMAMPLCGGPRCLIGGNSNFNSASVSSLEDSSKEDPTEMVRLAIMPGGLSEPQDFPPFRRSIGLGGSDPPVDIVVSTPAAVGPLGLKPKNIDMFADVGTVVVDEADMLLDGGYIRSLENVLLGFRRADKIDTGFDLAKTQHVFVAATLPDMGLRSVDAYLQKKFPYANRVTMAGMHNAKHYGLGESTVWLAVDDNRERMERLVEILKTPAEEGGLEKEKTMIFLNSVDDVEGAYGALKRAGFSAIKYHAKIPLKERTDDLDRFRNYDSSVEGQKGTVPIMVCTDLASRGLDIPGVTAVVQLQFAGNVVSHLHRMGRCGRAGQRNGRGLIFYDSKQRELIEVVRNAENQQERMILEGDVDEFEEEGAKVKKAFSRKRGFTKKLKKLRRESD